MPPTPSLGPPVGSGPLISKESPHSLHQVSWELSASSYLLNLNKSSPSSFKGILNKNIKWMSPQKPKKNNKKNNGKTKITSLLSILFLFINSVFFITIKWHRSLNTLTHQKQTKSKDSTAGIEVHPFWNSSLQKKLKWNIQRQRHKKSHFPVETVSEKPISEKSRLSRLSPSPPSLPVFT